MRILVINPNTSVEMTAGIDAAARKYAIIGDKSNEGQDASLRVEMGNPR